MTSGHQYFCSKWYTSALAMYDSFTWWHHQQIKMYDTSPLHPPIHINVHTFTHTHTHIYMCVCIYIYVYTQIYIYTHTYIYTHQSIHTCIYTLAHTYTHMHNIHTHSYLHRSIHVHNPPKLLEKQTEITQWLHQAT